MFGPDLLVAPIFSKEGEVTYYVPKGRWVGLLDKKERVGPSWFTETHDFLTLPILLREGATLVTTEDQKTVDYNLLTESFEVITNGPTKERTISVPQGKGQIIIHVQNGKAWARGEGGQMVSGKLTVL
jgi:alpha-D-xyloside xylohydrolase